LNQLKQLPLNDAFETLLQEAKQQFLILVKERLGSSDEEAQKVVDQAYIPILEKALADAQADDPIVVTGIPSEAEQVSEGIDPIIDELMTDNGVKVAA
jgi:hypothetical protein